jgi:spermidine synthase
LNHTRTSTSISHHLGYVLLLIYGALSLAAQVIILREFLKLAHGNEVFLGLGLWAWLIWTGCGSLLGGRFAHKYQVNQTLLVYLLILPSITLPLTIILIRALPILLGWSTGVAPTPITLSFWFIILSGPLCFFSGFFFPLSCRWLQTEEEGGGLLGQAYGLDAVGMALGGILLQILLLGQFDSLWLALIFGLFISSLMIWFLPLSSGKPWLPLLLVLLAVGLILAMGHWLSQISRHWQWPHRTLLVVQETPYSCWTATREAEQSTFAANGLWFFSYPDPQTAEEQVHFALLQHPDPKQVLLLGGGFAGLAAEILKTPDLIRLDYLEIDPQVIALARHILPSEALTPFQDSRLRLIYDDARRFMRQSQNYYDVIIMALPEPKNVMLNRFYTRDFFNEVKARLTPHGIFSFGLGGSETSLSPIRARYLATAAATLHQVFPDVLVLPGLTWRFFASPEPRSLSSDPGIWFSRRRARGIDLLYVRDYFVKANLSPGHQAYAREILAKAGSDVNTDLLPKGLFYGLVLTGTESGSLLSRSLLWLKQEGIGKIYVCLVLLALALWALSSQAGPRGRQIPFLFSVFTMGLTVMGLEMVVLILFQTALGYLYGQLGLLLAGFMAGMGGGAYLAGSRLHRGTSAARLALVSQGGLGFLMFILGAGLPWLLRWHYSQAEGWGQLIFAAILISAGLLSGVVFAVQGELSQQHGTALVLSAGRLYAVDLLGATLGTLGMSLLIIPCFGPAHALFLGAAWNAAAILLLASGTRCSRPAS